MKLWGGRFMKETNQLVHNFNASLSFDQKFYEEDIEGSIAHVTMLAEKRSSEVCSRSAMIFVMANLFLPKSTKIFIVLWRHI